MGTGAKVEVPTQRSLSSADLRAIVSALSRVDSEVEDAERVEQLRALEEIKNAAAAAQARVSVDFDTSLRLEQARRGVPASERGRGVAAQIALARRESRHRGDRLLGLAKLLVNDLPHTLAAMERGRVSEWRATLIAKSAVVLEDADRAALDAELGPRLEGMSDREVDAAARSIAYRVDPRAVVNRARRAAEDRRVSVRPAPDVMAIVSAYVPAAQGVAVYKALTEAAASAKAAGDPRALDQIKADTLVELVTGQESASGVPLEVGVVMTDAGLLARADDVARIEGYGPVPAAAARALVAGTPGAARRRSGVSGVSNSGVSSGGGVRAGFVRAGSPRLGDTGAPQVGSNGRADVAIDDADEVRSSGFGDVATDDADEVAVWVRRLYTDPFDRSVSQVDTRRRRFTGALRRFVMARDQVCRTPWCGAPVRDVDHIEAFAAGGATTAANGQGLCRACNLDKSAPGWRAGPEPPPFPRQPETPLHGRLGPALSTTESVSGDGGVDGGGEPPPLAAHVVYTTTPTGVTYFSAVPPVLPGLGPERPDDPDDLDWELLEEAHAAARADLARAAVA